ncbi:thioredoxin family protein [Aliifodinibius sp. S!AR15-10]|uniref:protein-disulfide reductase DsbD family protein n=1 Tax=Aliifodinibius sp. S!AR15-10 TaxID=2950437 RepID=UPI00285A984E|nr:cytochrome c biogenesis protein CcdA [Aliifodinibius sp. S!AR15-10]MDR8390480.1 thioredoxin family protein [Aliifodinibius sp. S!AR15-10]
MKIHQFIIASFAILLLLGLGNKLPAQPAGSAGKVEVEVKLSQNVVPAEDTAKAAVVMHIEEGWHVNAHKPTLDYLIGTELKIEEHPGFTVSGIQYPESERFTFAFAGEPLDVYQGDAPIFFTLATSHGLAPGSYPLTGNLRVQACDDKSCLPPSTIDISIPVDVVAANTGFKSINKNLFSANAGESISSSSASLSDNSIASMFNERGTILAFLGILLIGLALNLTPCVYPMLSVTVSLFGGQAEQKTSTRKTFVMASIYVLGIVSMYSVLGVAAAYTGNLFGNWLQSSAVLAGVGIILLAMALSMFGLYELQPPQWFLQKLGSTQGAVGPTGHFLSGIMVGIFAAPCIGPPVIALLTFVGAQGDPMFGFIVFFVMALGLGLPYLILGTFSSLLTKLPRSGEWMVWVKKVFGVVLVGAALFFLALAWFPKYVLYILPPTLILGGIYLGFLETSGRNMKIFSRVKRVVGIAGMIGGLLVIMNLAKPTVDWETYTPDKLEEAASKEMPVVLDFTADWCVPCLELDRITFTDPEVIAALEPYRTIKVDLTDYESREAEALRKQFGVAGVPTIIFLDENGNEVEEARIVGFVNADEFLRRMPE